VAGHPLALLAATLATSTGLAVMDVADPLHPVEMCGLDNATSGRFISATKVAFWDAAFLGVADLETGSLNWSRAFLTSPSAVAFNGDGSKWAYQAGDLGTGVTTHLVVGGKDQTILTRGPIKARGGPSWGPLSQLEFSAHGDYLLTFTAFGDTGAPPNFIVYTMDGSVAFRSPTAKFGVWDRAGNRLYFLAAKDAGGIGGQVSSLDPGGAPVVRSRGLASYFWPAISPDGRQLVFDSYDAKGIPHLWRLDIASRGSVQLSTGSSTRPVFVGPGVVWSTEDKPRSGPDGKVVAHDLQRTPDSLVGDFAGFTPSPAPTEDVLGVWFG
jgi:hypothetical protein